MEHRHWKDIWVKKGACFQGTPDLRSLLALDGYDSRTSNFGCDAWLDYVRHVADRLQIQPTDSVFDVGCGAGALLLPFASRGCPVGGLDYSGPLLVIARQVLPNAELTEGPADTLDTAKPYDFVVASGVFYYFPDLEYAGRVLELMMAKATKGVAVLDVPDLDRKGQTLARRRAAHPQGEYDRHYEGLEHLYFPQQWFLMFRRDAGLSCSIEAQVLACPNSTTRFNVYLEKNQRS